VANFVFVDFNNDGLMMTNINFEYIRNVNLQFIEDVTLTSTSLSPSAVSAPLASNAT